MSRSLFRTLLSYAAVAATGLWLAGCAQEVGDIDRTQPERIRKADLLNAEWFIRQTISDVPSTTDSFFIGYTFDTEKVRWEVQEDYVVAYRSYEYVPGANSDAVVDADGNWQPGGLGTEGRDPSIFRDQPIAAYPIVSHFDVQRSYNAQTGEQTNVIVENTSDRPWYEREFLRVDWSANMVGSFTFLQTAAVASPAYYVPEDEGGDDARRMVYDDAGELEYMDFVSRHFMEPSLRACIYMLNGYGMGDCAGQQVEVRTSVMRAPAISDYEAVTYDDTMMDKFGYFRTERVSYDRLRGTTMEGRIQLANRHNIWSNTWETNADGTLQRAADGQRIARPFAERTPNPIVYHLSPGFPEPLLPWVEAMAAEWDRAFRRAVAAARNEGDDSAWESEPAMFVLCNNPVTATAVHPAADPAAAAACGELGDEARIGDLRYNVVYWIHDPQQSGPLGYGPSAADPETGEIISGTAYVYGASVDTYAQVSLDMIRFINGDLTPDDLLDPEYVREQVRSGIRPGTDPRAGIAGGAIANTPVTRDVIESAQGLSRDRIQGLRDDLQQDGRLDSVRRGAGWEQARIRRIRDSGADLMALSDEEPALLGLNPLDGVSEDDIEQMRLSTWMEQMNPRAQRQRELVLGRECVWMAESIDDSIVGIARHYEGRTDYDVIYQEIRGLIFKAVMEHEVGHTIGLRHNFAGSWDSLNYFDEYWDAKAEGYPSVDEGGNAVTVPFGPMQTFADIYGISALTEGQIDARMREYQYSTIMDYSSSFNTDNGGIGRYDEAAILFAYTTGADRNQANPEGPRFNQQEPGYVEVWRDLPATAAATFAEFGGGIGYYQPLELYHYSTLVSLLADSPEQGIAQLRERELVRYDDVVSGDIGQNDVEVPYMFCSDEYNGSRQYCRTWDRGADPMEQTINYIERYRTFYYFDNYRRDRLGWFASDAGGRAVSRYFLPLVDGYQRWLLNVAIQSGRPDPGLDNMWTFSAYAGLNLIGEALATPNPGSYQLSEDGQTMELVSYAETATADIYVPEGFGRRRFSRYDAEDGYYYAKYPISAGHYWTYVNALFALTSAETSVTGVEVGTFDTTYIIPPYLVFEEQLTRMFNAIATGDNVAVAPVGYTTASGFRYEHRPMLTIGLTNGTQLNPETGAEVREDLAMTRDPNVELPYPVLDVRYGFSEQIYAMLLSLASFDANYSTRFHDQAHVVELAAGQVPELAPGFALLQFCDPTPAGVGKCYATWKQSDAVETGLAEEYVLRGQQYAADWQTAVEDRNNGAQRTAEQNLSNLLSDLNILMTLGNIFAGVPI